MAPSQEPALPPSRAAKEAEMSEMGVDKMGDTPRPHSRIKVSRRLSSQFLLEDDVHCFVELKIFLRACSRNVVHVKSFYANSLSSQKLFVVKSKFLEQLYLSLSIEQRWSQDIQESFLWGDCVTFGIGQGGRLCKEEASAAWERDRLSACPKCLPVFLAYQPRGWLKLQCTNVKTAAFKSSERSKMRPARHS
jgi:hypothetical protein